MSEEEFLKSTPKKLFRLAEIHQNMHSNNNNEEDTKEVEEPEMVYIDQLF